MNSGPINPQVAHRNGDDERDKVDYQTPKTGPLTGKEVDDSSSSRGARRSGKSASAFKTISEVADELDVQQHVLRFWETKFSQIRPLKRGGGRRYYRPEDMELLKRIHTLLYTEGYTIKGVQKLLREKGKAAVVQGGAPRPENNNEPRIQTSVKGSLAAKSGMNTRQRAALKAMLGELKDLRSALRGE